MGVERWGRRRRRRVEVNLGWRVSVSVGMPMMENGVEA